MTPLFLHKQYPRMLLESMNVVAMCATAKRKKASSSPACGALSSESRGLRCSLACFALLFSFLDPFAPRLPNAAESDRRNLAASALSSRR